MGTFEVIAVGAAVGQRHPNFFIAKSEHANAVWSIERQDPFEHRVEPEDIALFGRVE